MLPRRASPAGVRSDHVHGAVRGLDHRRHAELAQPRQQQVERDRADQHRRGQPAQPERGRLRMVQQLGERGLVVGPQERLGVTDPHRAEGPGGVVHEVGQRLRHRGPRDRAEEVVQLDRGPAAVERAAHRTGCEPVDGGPAA